MSQTDPIECPTCGTVIDPPGVRLRAARKAAGVRMAALARAMGVPRQRLHAEESGARGMSEARLAEWMRALAKLDPNVVPP